MDIEVRAETEKTAKSDNTEPVTGIKFVFLLLSLTFTSLLVFLDTSVVSTVSICQNWGRRWYV